MISKLLENEKYVGDAVLGKTQVKDGVQIKVFDSTIQTTIKITTQRSFSKNYLMPPKENI